LTENTSLNIEKCTRFRPGGKDELMELVEKFKRTEMV